MLATNAYCNRVFVRGTSSPPLVPTFVAPVYLFTSVHAHADSRTLSLVLTRMSRVTSSLFSTSSFLSLSYFSSFSFFFALIFFPFSLDLSPFPHRSISSPCLQAFSFYDAESRLFFLSFLYLFATLFYLFLFSLAPSFSF